MVIFHSYVSLPEGISLYAQKQMDLGNGCEILGTVEHGQARTHASTKLPRQSHFLFDCGVLETPQILGLEHKSKDKLQRVWGKYREIVETQHLSGLDAVPGMHQASSLKNTMMDVSVGSRVFAANENCRGSWVMLSAPSNAEARSLCSSTWMTFRPVLDGSRAPGIAAKSSARWIPMFSPHHRSCFGRPHGFLINDSMMMTYDDCV